MDSALLLTTLLVLLCYPLIIAMVIPMIRGKVPPNGLLGFRTALSQSDERIWYPVNRIAGRWMLRFAVGGLTLSLLLCPILWHRELLLLSVLSGLILVVVIPPAVLGNMAARRIAAELGLELES